jgi:DNA-binding SARP family transcriptional activator
MSISRSTVSRRFQLLGPVRAWSGRTELELGPPQQQAVLVLFLLARGQQVSLDEIIDALWSDQPPQSAVGIVRTYVSHLRSHLGQAAGHRSTEVIRPVARGYVLTLDSAAIDTDEFERLTRNSEEVCRHGDIGAATGFLRDALALWHGTPLAGIPGRHAEIQRIRLTELRTATVEEVLAMEIDSGRHLTAAAELRGLLAAEPLRERLSELLMLALYRSGRQAEALAVFAATRRRLRDALGIDPGPSLRQIHQWILRSDDRLMGRDAGQVLRYSALDLRRA